MPKLKKKPAVKTKAKFEPLWKGPFVDGITNSMLTRFLGCRERFRLYAIEGLGPADGFNHRLEYGNMWHLCEETGVGWPEALAAYAKQLASTYQTQQAQIYDWYNVCKVQYPIWLQYQSKLAHKDDKPVLREYVFKVPYELPDGRVVYLRGKWDGLTLRGKKKLLYLDEHKTKGDIKVEHLQRQLTFDLQTMLYLTALMEHYENYAKAGDLVFTKDYGPPQGVIYNVVRRPLSGGKGSISRHKATKGAKCPKCKGTGYNTPGDISSLKCPKCKGAGRVNAKPEESQADFYKRLGKLIEDEPEYYFMSWQVEVTRVDIAKFRRRCLDPLLVQVADWWQYMEEVKFKPWDQPSEYLGLHWQHPYGTYNVLDEGGSTDLDEHIENGSTVGLVRIPSLFRELE